MKIQASFNRIESNTISIYSVVIQDENGSKNLIIAKQGKYRERKSQDDMVYITDNPRSENYDYLFDRSMFSDALEAYMTLKQNGTLVIDASMEEFNIDNIMDAIRQRMTGETEYNVDLMNNGHFALLATCLFFRRQEQHTTAIKMIETVTSLYQTI